LPAWGGMIWANIFGAVPRWLKAALAGVLGAVLMFGAGYLVGSREAAQRADLEAAQDREATDRSIDDADVSSGDADDDRGWLFERGR